MGIRQQAVVNAALDGLALEFEALLCEPEQIIDTLVERGAVAPREVAQSGAVKRDEPVCSPEPKRPLPRLSS